ncbi:MAG: type II toxin-antitoxin system HicB family antitoxin [Nitrospirales bacterium]|nr:type II toxin-antitoxin system HicB family antitoxin [Nitrospira sp.]MDR4502916.1 type II toxin-antitoxin system HicB family antitoxin [Nitrospirales bacterium]
MDYVAIIHKDEGSHYGVSFPDFPGCVIAGGTVDDAKNMAAEALALHVEGLQEDGIAIPRPSSLEVIMKSPDFANGVAFLVSLQQPDRTVRVNLTMTERELPAIDAAAAAQGMKRSTYLVKTGLQSAH